MNAFQLPTPVATAGAAGWALSDWQQLRQAATADATGTATLDLGQVDPTTQWLVDRLVVQTTSTASTTLRLYDSTVAPANLLDATSSGNINTADYPAGLLVRPSTSLVAQWTGATFGAVCTLTAQVRVFRQAGA